VSLARGSDVERNDGGRTILRKGPENDPSDALKRSRKGRSMAQTKVVAPNEILIPLCAKDAVRRSHAPDPTVKVLTMSENRETSDAGLPMFRRWDLTGTPVNERS
jgi:hypothetical protein